MIETDFTCITLSDVYEAINYISSAKQTSRSNSRIFPLWFRGHTYSHYTLLPTLYRQEPNPSVKKYSRYQLKESYNIQHFQSRVTHLIPHAQNGVLEWQELYQHYLGSTRLMDWTESADTALLFALEPFIDSRNLLDLQKKREDCTPMLWIIDPHMLNRITYSYLSDHIGTITNALSDIVSTKKPILANTLSDNMKKHKEQYLYADELSRSELEGIPSLCALEEYRNSNLPRLKNLLQTGELNPFFYLLLRYYVDCIPFEIVSRENILPPVAVLQPYHSERIRAQRGTFTAFPNYVVPPNMDEKRLHVDFRAMENQMRIKDILFRIRLIDPSRIAWELLNAGERRSELYPDVEVYVQGIKSNGFYL